MEFWKRFVTSYQITLLHYHVSFSHHEQFWSIFCRVSHWAVAKIWCLSSISCQFFATQIIHIITTWELLISWATFWEHVSWNSFIWLLFVLAHTLQMQAIFWSLESYGLMNIFPGLGFCDILPQLHSISPKGYDPMNYAMPIDIVFSLAQFWWLPGEPLVTGHLMAIDFGQFGLQLIH